MKIYISKEKEICFILHHNNEWIVVAHSIYPDKGGLWVVGVWKDIRDSCCGSDYEETNHLHFLSVFGFTPERVWELALKTLQVHHFNGKSQPHGQWIL